MKGLVAFVALAAVLSVCGAELRAEATLVLLVDETGPGARTGLVMRTAADLTSRQLAEAGGGERVALRTVEYGGSAERAVDLIRALLAERTLPTAVLGACDAETTVKVAALLRRAGVPMLCPVPLAPSPSLPLTGDDVGWVDGVLQLAASAPRQVAALVDYAADRLGARRIGLVYGATWRWSADLVGRRVQARGLNLAFATEMREGGQPPDVSRCDALIVASDRDPGVDVAAWALARPSRPAVLAVSSLLLTGPVAALEGAVVTVTGAYDPAEPQTERFGRTYALEYARVPGETVLLSRDALVLLAAALAGGGGPGQLAAALRRAASTRGLTGALSFDAEGRRTAPIVLVEVRGRTVRPLGPAGGSVPVPSVLSPSAASVRTPAAPVSASSGQPFGTPWWESEGAVSAPSPSSSSSSFSSPSPSLSPSPTRAVVSPRARIGAAAVASPSPSSSSRSPSAAAPAAPPARAWWESEGAASAPSPSSLSSSPSPSPPPAPGTPWWTQGSPGTGTGTDDRGGGTATPPASPGDQDLPWWKRPDVAASLPSLPPAPRLPQGASSSSTLPPAPGAGSGAGLPPAPSSASPGLSSLPLPPASSGLGSLPAPPAGGGLPALPPPPRGSSSSVAPPLPLPRAAADLSGLPPPPQPLGTPARVTPLPPPTPTPTPTPTSRPTPSPTGGSRPWWQSGEASY